MSQDQNKVISLANHKGDRNSVNQLKLEHVADAAPKIATLTWWGCLRAPMSPRAMLAGPLEVLETGQRLGARQRAIYRSSRFGGFA